MSMTLNMIATQLLQVLSAKLVYQKQGMYAHPNRNLGDDRPVFRGKGASLTGGSGGRDNTGPMTSPKFNPLSLSGCFNCCHPCHTMQDGHEKIDTKRTALRRLEYLSKRHNRRNVAAAVLYQLSQQLDAMVVDDGELESPAFIDMVSEDDGADEAACFEALCMSEEGTTREQAAPSDDPYDDESPPPQVHFAPGV